MAVDATAMAGRSLRFDAAAKRRVRAGCRRCRRRLRWSARPWRIVSTTGGPGASVAIHGRRRSERSRSKDGRRRRQRQHPRRRTRFSTPTNRSRPPGSPD